MPKNPGKFLKKSKILKTYIKFYKNIVFSNFYNGPTIIVVQYTMYAIIYKLYTLIKYVLEHNFGILYTVYSCE